MRPDLVSKMLNKMMIERVDMLRPACNQCAGLFEKWLEEEEEEEEEEWV